MQLHAETVLNDLERDVYRASDEGFVLAPAFYTEMSDERRAWMGGVFRRPDASVGWMRVWELFLGLLSAMLLSLDYGGPL